MGKFKVGDYIRISDKNDAGYRYNNLYKVVKVTDTGYDLMSIRYNTIYDEEFLLSAIGKLLKNNEGHKTVAEFYDNNCRLATSQEIVLYGREQV
jgi:hypothetical protein